MLSIPLQWYLHSNRPDLKASRLETCRMQAYRLSYVRAPDYSGEAANPASNGSFDFSVPTLQSPPPSCGWAMLKKAEKKKLNDEMDAAEGKKERCVERKGTLRGRDGRNGTRGNGREEAERSGEMKGPEKVPRWKRGGEQQWACIRETTNETHPFTKQNSLCFSISSSSLNVDILQLFCPGSPGLCFLSAKGDHGGWSSVDPGARQPLMEECCCLLQRTPSQLETHLWAFLSSLPARSKQPPLQCISTFPCSISQMHTLSAE